MNMRSKLVLAVLATGLFAGCGSISGTSKPPVTVLAVDVSGSTAGMSGDFSGAIRETMRKTAASRGWIWAASGDRAILASSKWTISQHFAVDGEEAPDLQAEDLRAKADKLAASPAAQSLLARPGRKGSDLLGFLRMAGSVLARNPDAPRFFVLLSDGGINIGGAVDLFRNPPTTPAAIDALIASLERDGLLKPGVLSGATGKPVGVFLCGIGRGAYGLDGRAAGFIQDFWNQLIVEAGGHVINAQPSCGEGSLEGLGG